MRTHKQCMNQYNFNLTLIKLVTQVAVTHLVWAWKSIGHPGAFGIDLKALLDAFGVYIREVLK